MVQIIKTEDPRSRLSEMLGMSLGQGIGSGLNTFFANRSLESVLQDKSLEGADPSRKLEAIRSALSPYGEKGQEIFQQRMAIEQQEMNEKETARNRKTEKIKGSAIGKFQKGEKLSDEEWGLFTPQEVAALQKAYNPRPPGGLSGQPVPPDVGNAINQVLNNNKNSSADELAQSLDAAGIPRTYSNSYIETRRRQDETRATNVREDQKIGRQEQLQFHKESEKYDEELMKQGRIAKQQQETLKKITQSINSGNVKPSSVANIFKGFGKIGDKISEALLNEDQATILTSIPQLLEGWKDVFGVRLTDADLRVLQDKLPSIGKSPVANKAVINILNKYAEMNLLRNQIAEDIKKNNGNLRPLGYGSQIEQRFDEMTHPVKIIRPSQNGQPGREIEIPAYKLSEAIKAGAKLANE